MDSVDLVVNHFQDAINELSSGELNDQAISDVHRAQMILDMLEVGNVEAANRMFHNQDTAARDAILDMVSTKSVANAFTDVLGINWLAHRYNSFEDDVSVAEADDSANPNESESSENQDDVLDIVEASVSNVYVVIRNDRDPNSVVLGVYSDYKKAQNQASAAGGWVQTHNLK